MKQKLKNNVFCAFERHDIRHFFAHSMRHISGEFYSVQPLYNTRSSKLIACLNAGLNSVHFFKLSGTLLVERSKRQNNEIKNTNNTN